MEQRHDGEGHPSHDRKRFCVHGHQPRGRRFRTWSERFGPLRVTSAAIPQEPGTTAHLPRVTGWPNASVASVNGSPNLFRSKLAPF
jgi:hypothetical protein